MSLLSKTFVLAVVATLSSLPLRIAAQNCSTGVHIIVARASTEAPGPGIIGKVASQVVTQVSGSDIVAVDYPATLSDYVNSQTAGVTAMLKLVTDYAAACPNSKMVLMGYSQGAQVAADVACGATEQNFPVTQPLSRDIANKIVAIVLMGDPSHVPGLSFDRGNATQNGFFPRQNSSTTCANVASKMVSYCTSGDTFCDSGKNTTTGGVIHRSYVQQFGSDAVSFVVSNAKTPAQSIGSAADSIVFSAGLLIVVLAIGGFTLA